MARATTHLDMLVHSGMFYSQIQPQISATLTAMAARGVHVRLCFGDPEGASAALRDREERIGGTLSAKVRSSLCYYRELVGVGGIEIRLHDTTLYASLWRYDDEMLINPQSGHTPAPLGSESADRALSTLVRAGMGDGTTVGRRDLMGRTDYLDDPNAPRPNTLVPAAGILAVDDDGRLLLQRRRDTGQWAIPMGRMELGETPTQCAIRETQEETGITVEPTGLLGLYSYPGYIVAYDDHEDPSQYGEVRQEFEITLIGRAVAGAPAVSDEADGVRWFRPDDLDQLDIHPRMWQQLGDYLAGVRAHVD
jgi:8-oxo-dGTP pyrophosphatase MutT (NUDIX family)